MPGGQCTCVESQNAERFGLPTFQAHELQNTLVSIDGWREFHAKRHFAPFQNLAKPMSPGIENALSRARTHFDAAYGIGLLIQNEYRVLIGPGRANRGGRGCDRLYFLTVQGNPLELVVGQESNPGPVG